MMSTGRVCRLPEENQSAQISFVNCWKHKTILSKSDLAITLAFDSLLLFKYSISCMFKQSLHIFNFSYSKNFTLKNLLITNLERFYKRHVVLRKATHKYFHTALTRARRRPTGRWNGVVIVISGSRTTLLEKCILLLDFETLSKDVMELLTFLQLANTELSRTNKNSTIITTIQWRCSTNYFNAIR